MIAIPPHLESNWHALNPRCRDFVEGFLQPDREPAPGVAVIPTIALPQPFARDLIDGASQLRAAFPRLRRTLAGIRRRGTRITVRIACEGDHEEPFFGIVLATHRHVQFTEEHNIQTDDGTLREDRVTIDLAGIIRQLH